MVRLLTLIRRELKLLAQALGDLHSDRAHWQGR